MNTTEDSGIIDLAAFRDSLAMPAPSDPGHLLGIGLSGPIAAPKPVTRRDVAWVLPAISLLLATGSVAFAMHTVLTPELAPMAVAPVAPQPSPVIHDVPGPVVDAVAPVIEVVTDAQPETPPPTRRVTRPTPRPPVTTAPPNMTPAITAPATTTDLEELMRLAGGLPTNAADAPTDLRTLRPSRGQVAAAFRRAASEVRACTTADGVVSARVFLVGETGRARSARITGAEGSEAACMERALMNVQVEPFVQERLQVNFPFRL